MTNLVKIETINGMNVVSSRDVADGLGKRHSDVLESIENIIKNSTTEISVLVIESSYKAKNGKMNKEYLLTKDGFILYMFNIQGYQDFKLAYINKFNEMEKVLQNQYYIPQNYSEALKLAYEQQEQIQLLNNKIETDRPKVIFAEALEISNNNILIGDLAKILKQNGIDIGQNRLFEYLRSNGYLCSRGEQYNLPTQKSLELGLFEVKTRTINNPDGSVRVTRTTKVTPKGQSYFINQFKKEYFGN